MKSKQGASLILCSLLLYSTVKMPAGSAKERTMLGEESVESLVKGRNGDSVDSRTEEFIMKELVTLREKVDKSATRMSLDQCLDYGIKRNYQLAAAYATIQEYEYKLIGIKRGFYPTLELSSLPPFLGKVKTQSTQSQVTETPVTVNPNGTYQYEGVNVLSEEEQEYQQFAPYITLTWSFFQPSLPASISSAKASLEQQRLAFDVTARSAILTLQQSYYQLQSSKALIDDFEKIYKINLEQVKYTEERQKAGLIDIGSVDQARSQLYAQASQLISYYQSYLTDAADLALAMNAPGDMLIVPSERFKAIGEWDEPVKETIENALKMREEIKEYLESAESSIWSSRAAIRSYLPELQLQGFAYGYNQKGTTNGLAYNDKYRFGAVGFGVTWEVFDGGVNAASASSYLAAAKNAKMQAQYMRQSVKQQIRSAYATYQTSKIALKNSQLNLDAATNSIKVNRARFGVGLANITSIVQAMQLLGEATQEYNTAILNHNTSIAELYRYSALWPNNTKEIVDDTKQELKKDG